MASSRPGSVADRGAAVWLLAIESATAVTSVALFRGETCVAESARGDGSAAELLMPSVDAVLREARIAPDGLAAIAVSIGPGSFTGLRVGLATAKGLVLGTSIALVPVPTLAALAIGPADESLPVLALLDARRGEMYAGLYDCRDGPPRVLVAEGVYAPEELIPKLPNAFRVVGEGAAHFGPELRRTCGAGVVVAPSEASARWVGRLGVACLGRGETVPAAAVTPRYWRRAEAEVKRTGERFEAPKEPG